MARLAKADIHSALERAARHIVSAAGNDPFISRADMEKKLATLEGVEKTLTDVFFRFIDHRDYRKGARVTAADVESAVEYAKSTMIDRYDLNNNGLSKAEIQEMSLTGKLAVRLARTMKESAAQQIEDTEKLAAQLRELGDGLYFPAWEMKAMLISNFSSKKLICKNLRLKHLPLPLV